MKFVRLGFLTMKFLSRDHVKISQRTFTLLHQKLDHLLSLQDDLVRFMRSAEMQKSTREFSYVLDFSHFIHCRDLKNLYNNLKGHLFDLILFSKSLLEMFFYCQHTKIAQLVHEKIYLTYTTNIKHIFFNHPII